MRDDGNDILDMLFGEKNPFSASREIHTLTYTPEGGVLLSSPSLHIKVLPLSKETIAFRENRRRELAGKGK